MSGGTVVEPSLEDQLADVAGHLNVQHSRWVDVTVAAIECGGWQGEDIRSVEHWLTIQMGASPASAKQIAKIAAAIVEFPHIRRSFSRGELSVDQVYVAVTKAPAWADQMVDEFAKISTVRQLRRYIRDRHFEGDPDEPAPEPKTERDRVGFGWGDDGRFSLHANLDAADGAVVEAALNEARDALFRDGDDQVTWVGALGEVCGRSLQSAPVERRERFKTYLHIHTDNGRTQLTNGTPLPDAVRDYLLCDGLVQPVWETDNIPVGVGRTQRTVPDRLRRLVEHRDQGCRVPGCTTTHVEIHHIVHWSAGGPTESSNLASVCARHHRQHHNGQIGITGNADDPNGLVFTDPHGHTLDEHGRPRVPAGPPPRPDGEYRHPSGGRMNGHWINFMHPNAVKRRHQLAIESWERRKRLEREHLLEATRHRYHQNDP